MKKPSFFLTAAAAYMALFLFHWCYTFQYDWDIVADLLFVHKYGNFSLAGVHPRAALLPLIFYPFSFFIDPLNFLILLSAVALAASIYLFRDLLRPFVSDRAVLISVIVLFSCRAFYVTACEMDDNFFQVPLLLTALRIFLSGRAGDHSPYACGLAVGTATAVHLQSAVFIPALAFGLFYKFSVVENGGVRKGTMAAGAGLVSAAAVPLVLWGGLLLANFEGFKAGLSYYYNDPRFSTAARGFDDPGGLVTHIALYAIFMAHNLVPIPRPFYYPVDLSFHYAAVFILPLFLAVVFFPVFRRVSGDGEALFFRSNAVLIIFSCAFNFLYEPGSHERWATAAPFFYLNFALGASMLLRGSGPGLKKALHRAFPAVAAAVFTVGAAVICASFVCKARASGRDIYAYPNRASFHAAAAACADGIPLVAGFDVPWMMLSYLRPGPVIYQNGVMIHEVTRGVITTYRTVEELKKFLLKYDRFYFHESAYGFVAKHFEIPPAGAEIHADIGSAGLINRVFGFSGGQKIYLLRLSSKGK